VAVLYFFFFFFFLDEKSCKVMALSNAENIEFIVTKRRMVLELTDLHIFSEN